VSEHPDPRPRDDTDAVKDLARNLADIAAQISTFKGVANAYLGDRLRRPAARAGDRPRGGGGEEAGAAQRGTRPVNEEAAQEPAEPRSWWQRMFGG
jgi:hypothetical protein